ncbi:AraC family transcriptional regulator, partial [bacterium]
MKKAEISPLKFTSLSELHSVLQLPKPPQHLLVSMVENMPGDISKEKLDNSFIMDFYKISYVESISGKLKYGQDFYDFDEGGLFF